LLFFSARGTYFFYWNILEAYIMVHGMIKSDMIYSRDTFHGILYGTVVDVHFLCAWLAHGMVHGMVLMVDVVGVVHG
jgi:hypothetical protein